MLGYDSMFLKAGELPARQQEAVAKIQDAVNALVDLSKRDRFDLLVILLPNHREVGTGSYLGPLEQLAQTSRPADGVYFVDVMKSFHEKGIATEADAAPFFWPIDGHPTPEGYYLMGRAVAERLLELGAIK